MDRNEVAFSSLIEVASSRNENCCPSTHQMKEHLMHAQKAKRDGDKPVQLRYALPVRTFTLASKQTLDYPMKALANGDESGTRK
jgi:hypothetical protein